MKQTAIILCLLLAAQAQDTSKAARLYDAALNLMTGGAQTRDPIKAVDDLRESARLGYAPAQTAMVFYAKSQQEAGRTRLHRLGWRVQHTSYAATGRDTALLPVGNVNIVDK